MMKTKIVFLGILLFSAVNTNGLFAQRPPYGIALDKSKTVFLDKAEISVYFWVDYYKDIRKEYGDTSLEAQQVLPDTALFSQVYGCPFGHRVHPQIYFLPMTCISREQILNYC